MAVIQVFYVPLYHACQTETLMGDIASGLAVVLLIVVVFAARDPEIRSWAKGCLLLTVDFLLGLFRHRDD